MDSKQLPDLQSTFSWQVSPTSLSFLGGSVVVMVAPVLVVLTVAVLVEELLLVVDVVVVVEGFFRIFTTMIESEA